MKRNTIALMLATILALPGALLAQGHHPQGREGEASPGMMGMGPGMMGMGPGMMSMGPGMMGFMRSTASLILGQKEALDLTESQVKQLEAIQEEMVKARKAAMERIQPLYTQGKKALEGNKPQFSQYESALKKVAAVHVNMQVEMARFNHRALQVLNPEQRSNVRYGMHLRRRMISSAGCPMLGATGVGN